VIDLRRQAAERNDLLSRRLDVLVPRLMAEQGIDCWVLIGREYAEDPVLRSMLPAEWLSARRRTILVLTPDDRFAISRYRVGDLFPSAWDPDEEPDQWRRLAGILDDLDPQAIGIGTSPTQAHADGLTVTQRDALYTALPDHLRDRVVSAGTLGVRWLETRLPEERHALAEATSVAHEILRTGLSREAVIPGTTTTDDLVWWYRQTVHDAGLASWFQPSVSTQRRGSSDDPRILPGDLVHVDFGIVHADLCTDQQEHAYVLGPGESSAPEGLRHGLARANRIQDILMEEFVEGRSGNEILHAARTRASQEDLAPCIYTHSIGIHGHGAGMTIGLWDAQDGVPGPGDHPLYRDTAYSIELSSRYRVPEWDGRETSFMVEQDAWFDGATCSWLDGRQDDLWLI
jgi:hypothetical protein